MTGWRLFLRNFSLLVALGTFVLAALDLTAGQFVPGTVGLITATASSVYWIRTQPKPDPPRPDYALIASMEQEVFGEAYEHAGAPPAMRGAYAHRPAHGGGHCLACDLEWLREARTAPKGDK